MKPLFAPDPAMRPPGPGPTCDCLEVGSWTHRKLPVLHAEAQDTSCDAWRLVNETIEAAATRGDTVLEPLVGLDGEQRSRIITLPASIERLKGVRELRLYGSHLVRLPPQIGGMASLEHLDVYTSYRLHFLPYEITRCRRLSRSRVSTRALYGNYKFRPPFPHVERPENREALGHLTPASCSVCAQPLGHVAPIHRWITLAVGTDVVPLLVTACSMACVTALPIPPAGYVQMAHTGGRHVVQPPPG